MANADNGPLGFIEGMECQSALEMTYMNRSPSGPPSAFPDRDGFSSWSGPDHAIPSISDHRDRVSFGLLSNYSGSVSFRKSVSKYFPFILDLANDVLNHRLRVSKILERLDSNLESTPFRFRYRAAGAEFRRKDTARGRGIGLFCHRKRSSSV